MRIATELAELPRTRGLRFFEADRPPLFIPKTTPSRTRVVGA
jgi:hypothetical protein